MVYFLQLGSTTEAMFPFPSQSIGTNWEQNI